MNKFYERVKKIFENNNKCKIIKNTSENAVKLFENNSLDIVFIDAEHTYPKVKQDINNWLEKVKNKGYLTGHDYSLTFFGVIKAVNETLGEDNIKVKQDAVWIYKKD